MNFTQRQLRLLEFVKIQHGDQVRKYTGHPYWYHVVAVAEKLVGITPEGLYIEIALCHDLLEDTACDKYGLQSHLSSIGYKGHEAVEITNRVLELTEQYTKEKYQNLNRKERKILEARRLWEISPVAQTVKYADMLDNTADIYENDKGFAEVYIEEKKEILKGMRAGNGWLLSECEKQIETINKIV